VADFISFLVQISCSEYRVVEFQKLRERLVADFVHAVMIDEPRVHVAMLVIGPLVGF